MGDKWGEGDTRYLYAAILCCSLLGKLDSLNVGAAEEYVLRCQNFDGAFGLAPGCESHTGQVFCCIGALAIAQRLHRIDVDRVARW
jgi:geranylgeranyl transferase type-2 subunit beta